MSSQCAETAEGCELKRAFRLMTEALEILDRNQAPSDIGAHLDLALARLRDRLSEGDAPLPGK